MFPFRSALYARGFDAGGGGGDDLSDLFDSGEVGDWWRFDNVHTNQTSIGSAITQATGIVNGLVMTRASGLGVTLEQPGGYYAMKTQNGRMAYNFGSAVSQPGTIIICLGDSDANTHVIATGSSNTSRWQISNTSGGDVIMFAGSTLDTTLNEPPASTAAVFTAVFDGGSSLFRRNGTQLATGNAGTQSTNQLTLGALWDQTFPGTINFFSALFIDRTLTGGSGGELDRAERLFATHAGITPW